MSNNMSEGNWWDNPFFAPTVVVTVILAGIAGIVKFFEGKKSNIKEARDLALQTEEKAVAKTQKERADAKILYTEKTDAAESVEKKRKEDAIDVKSENRYYVDNKFRFSDQQHSAEHAELKNEVKILNTKIEQVSLDLKSFRKQYDDYNEECRRRDKQSN